jgi:hypothetical protein
MPEIKLHSRELPNLKTSVMNSSGNRTSEDILVLALSCTGMDKRRVRTKKEKIA